MSSKQQLPNGFTLMEMVVTIVLFGVIAVVGSQLISKLAPSYLMSVQAQQSLSPREAALWRLSEDFRRALLVGDTNMLPGNCRMSMMVASGMVGNEVVSHMVAYWMDGGKNLWMSNATVSGILLSNVKSRASNGCPISYTQTGCAGRMCLFVDFDYPDPADGAVHIPVSAILYSTVNGPYVSAIAPGTGAVSTTIPVTVTGFFPGVVPGNVAFLSGVVPISSVDVLVSSDHYHITAKVSSVQPATVDVVVSSVHGKSTLRGQFRIQ
jgi:prepilin-type N-terminal cleavage/methylation domain-containing protein